MILHTVIAAGDIFPDKSPVSGIMSVDGIPTVGYYESGVFVPVSICSTNPLDFLNFTVSDGKLTKIICTKDGKNKNDTEKNNEKGGRH